MDIQQNKLQEDEIDLRELFKTIWSRRFFVAIVTCIITAVAIVYALLKTPIYEATALIEIGSYRAYNNNNNINLLDDASALEKKLNVLFIDINKNKKNREAEIVSIAVPKNQNNFLDIKAESVSNELATQEINKVVSYIQNKHQVILDNIKERREFEIKNIESKILNIKNKEVVLLNEKIQLQEESLIQYKKELTKITENMKKIENINPSLTALKLMEKRDISNFILQSNLQLVDIKIKRDELLTDTVNKLYEEKNILASMLLPQNYKNSEIIGRIIINDYPIKPKKILIVVIAFVTGLILSIFLVFILEFAKSFKQEESAQADL